MKTVLYIEASPVKTRSHSIGVAHRFLDAYRHLHPADEIDRLDLWATTLPPFDAHTIDAKFAVLRTQQFTPEHRATWDTVRAVAQRFNRADKYVFSVPMWNFSIPYPLKHFIDVVTLPGENWAWSPTEGYRGLLTGKKALLIYASAGDYGAAASSPWRDFQKPYLRQWLRFLGITDTHEITVAPTLTDPESLARITHDAATTATALVDRF
jgi:FMN-dependent NADH-azoreductase